MKARPVLLALAVAALTSLSRSSAAGEGFVVVVNQANPVQRLTRGEVSQLFLKRVKTWPAGGAVVPCDLSATDPVRAAFSLGVHHKPAWYVVGFWQQEISSGRTQPPKVFGEAAAALAAVRDDPGAITYVSEDASLGPGLKRLDLVP